MIATKCPKCIRSPCQLTLELACVDAWVSVFANPSASFFCTPVSSFLGDRPSSRTAPKAKKNLLVTTLPGESGRVRPQRKI